MSVKGLGNICFLISDCSEQSEWIINIINRIAEKIYHTVVIVNDENLEIAQKVFSYRVEINGYNLRGLSVKKKSQVLFSLNIARKRAQNQLKLGI